MALHKSPLLYYYYYFTDAVTIWSRNYLHRYILFQGRAVTNFGVTRRAITETLHSLHFTQFILYTVEWNGFSHLCFTKLINSGVLQTGHSASENNIPTVYVEKREVIVHRDWLGVYKTPDLNLQELDRKKMKSNEPGRYHHHHHRQHHHQQQHHQTER